MKTTFKNLYVVVNQRVATIYGIIIKEKGFIVNNVIAYHRMVSAIISCD